ncbi:MAG: vWA domain-containing protein [Pseudomonadota bacterium]
MKKSIVPAIVFVVFGAVIWTQFIGSSPPPQDEVARLDQTRLVPDWAAISSWPPSAGEAAGAQANPDPWQVTTMIILDDSSSMRDQMNAAKQAVIQAVGQFDPDSRVGVIALNKGMVMPVQLASDASRSVENDLASVSANGATPLGASLSDAAGILTQEAQNRRGFGVFRILVTTDGAASDSDLMNDAVADILSTTPIEIATIGIGIGEGHALNVPGYTSYVSVSSVDQLAGALQEAAAEQTTFNPITEFSQ